jgi:hypothetical protein
MLGQAKVGLQYVGQEIQTLYEVFYDWVHLLKIEEHSSQPHNIVLAGQVQPVDNSDQFVH